MMPCLVRLLACFLVSVFALLILDAPASAQVTRYVRWEPGPGSEGFFRRIREGTPSTCAITHRAGQQIDNTPERHTLLMSVDCRNRPTGGKFVFESFRGRQTVGDWRVNELRVVPLLTPPGTHHEWVERPGMGGRGLQTRYRLVAQRGRIVSVQVSIIAKNTNPNAASGTLEQIVWCDTGSISPASGSFRCAGNGDCQRGQYCSATCGNICVRRQ
jgi:hypothetical protein